MSDKHSASFIDHCANDEAYNDLDESKLNLDKLQTVKILQKYL